MINFLLQATPEKGDLAFIVGIGGALIVIIIMIVLACVFILLGKIMSKNLRLKKTVSQPVATTANSTAEPIELKGKLSANTAAAIAAAIYQYMDEAHEDENAIITIDRAAKSYSPWSSKIYATHKGIFNSGRR
ncbi:MAG: OadG family transporter subunit [Flavobacteriales bacterium]|nr:OadG family transporter subunit [Flavobacteriales bacterium]